jgi:Pyridoxamine 5''-phosphate oxidase.
MTSPSDPLVQELVQRRSIATLATHNPDGSTHLTSVWFVFEDGHFYVGDDDRHPEGAQHCCDLTCFPDD